MKKNHFFIPYAGNKRTEVERIRTIIVNYEQEIQKLKETKRQINESYTLIERKYKTLPKYGN
jgi:hypothetical protein